MQNVKLIHSQVKDMRFQALMPDILHWLGITKIDRMLSMSNMKYDAIVDQGIPIHERVPIPDEVCAPCNESSPRTRSDL